MQQYFGSHIPIRYKIQKDADTGLHVPIPASLLVVRILRINRTINTKYWIALQHQLGLSLWGTLATIGESGYGLSFCCPGVKQMAII